MKKFLILFMALFAFKAGFSSITINPSTIDSGFCAHDYSFKCTATGGRSPYAYTVSVGSLPNGLFLNKLTGRIEGRINYQDATSVTFTIKATDAVNANGTRSYTMYITNKVVNFTTIIPAWSGIPNPYPTYAQIYDTWRLYSTTPPATGSWSTTGNTLTTAKKLGSLDSVDIVLYAKNVERMRIRANGNTGIGTASPTSTLQVNGSFRYVDSNEGTGKVLVSNSTGVGTWTTPTDWRQNGNAVTSEKWFGTSTKFDIPFKISSAEVMRIDTNNRVGIGTASATARLHVKGLGSTSGSYEFKTMNSNEVQYFAVRDDGVTIQGNGTTIFPNSCYSNLNGNVGTNGSINVANDNADDYIRFTNGAGNVNKLMLGWSASGATIQAYNNPLLINVLANFVGIGAVTAPSAELHVKGSGTTTAYTFKSVNSADQLNLSVRDDGRINMRYIPTDSTGLATGDLYRLTADNIIRMKY